jgi:phosphoglycolate phosphatase-like HAD superfamily hydrolase
MAYQCVNKERRLYFKKDSSEALSDITKLIFDFDGVLVQTSQSYRQTIRKVVDYYFLEILGLEGEKGKLATLGDIQKFKDTGLYNNDWNLSYAIITHYLALLMRKLKRKGVLQDFRKRFNNIQFSEIQSFLQILGEVGDFLRRYGMNATELANVKNDDTLGLESFLTQTNLENQNLSETPLEPGLPQVGSIELTLIRRLIPYDLEKPELLKRLFEESYLGKELFNKFYGIPSVFKFNESFLENETFIPTKETLEVLRLRFGKFAIYSERPAVQGKHILEKNDYERYFDRKASIFQEELFESRVDGKGIRLGKPHPTLFIELVQKLVGTTGEVAYVGDGVADAVLVENARLKGLSNLSFLGVLCSSQYPNKLLSRYMKHKADAIMTDVNDIPNLLASLGGKN